MRRSLGVFALTFILILAAAIQGNVQAQSFERNFQNGYSVRGAFLEFYENAPDPLLLFGYPISREISRPDGTLYQYFQYARFDLVNGPDGPVVELFPLGKILYTPSDTIPPLNTNSPACRRFESGFSVCYSFLSFYDRYQGETYIGSPISNIEVHDGRYVQYFENASMEWRPDSATGEVVGLGDLGRLYVSQFDPLPQDPGGYSLSTPESLQAHAFVTQALVPAQGTQTVYVIVQDQNFEPVEGARVMMSVYYPNDQYDLLAPITNADGISQYSFQVSDVPVKEVVRVEVLVTIGTSEAGASTWFRSWW
jgi:hypothetical protein